jgi:hypothetical protein
MAWPGFVAQRQASSCNHEPLRRGALQAHDAPNWGQGAAPKRLDLPQHQVCVSIPAHCSNHDRSTGEEQQYPRNDIIHICPSRRSAGHSRRARVANHLGATRSGAGSAAEPSGAVYGLLSPLLVVHAVALQKPLPRFATWTSGQALAHPDDLRCVPSAASRRRHVARIERCRGGIRRQRDQLIQDWPKPFCAFISC